MANLQVNQIRKHLTDNYIRFVDASDIKATDEDFTDYGKAQQGKEIPVPASCMNKPFRYQEGKHRKSDAPDTAHRFV